MGRKLYLGHFSCIRVRTQRASMLSSWRARMPYRKTGPRSALCSSGTNFLCSIMCATIILLYVVGALNPVRFDENASLCLPVIGCPVLRYLSLLSLCAAMPQSARSASRPCLHSHRPPDSAGKSVVENVRKRAIGAWRASERVNDKVSTPCGHGQYYSNPAFDNSEYILTLSLSKLTRTNIFPISSTDINVPATSASCIILPNWCG